MKRETNTSSRGQILGVFEVFWSLWATLYHLMSSWTSQPPKFPQPPTLSQLTSEQTSPRIPVKVPSASPPLSSLVPELGWERCWALVQQVRRTRRNRRGSRCFQWCWSSVVIEFSFVSYVCQLWALNVKLQYCNVKTQTISGLCCFFL